MSLLERPNAAHPRFFPDVDRLLRPGAEPEAQILALARSPFRLIKPRAPERQAAALLWLFREGMRAELEDRWRRADFFWDEAHRILQGLQRAEGGIVRALALLLARMPAGNEAIAESVAARVIDEIFIDTHAGFYNGRVKSVAELPRDDRAFAHLERIKALLPSSGMNERERAAFLRPVRRAQFKAFKQDRAWNNAARIARELLEAEPDDLGAQEHLIEAVVQGALASLSNDNSDSTNRRGVKSLQKAIRELEAMRPKMPLSEDLYGALRHLHHMCAIRLANRGQFSQALVSVQTATDLAQAAEEARNVALWRKIDLAPPTDRWADRAGSLFSALTAVFVRQPTDRVGVSEAWKAIVADHPNLAGVDDERVIHFLAYRILGETWEPAATDEIAEESKSSSPPLLATTHGSRKAGGAPFAYWLYSGQDLGMKVRWVTIVALVGLCLGLWSRESSERTRREHAFAALTYAAANYDAPGVLAAAEQFLTAHLFAADPREPEVVAAYRRAIVDWFTGLRQVTDADKSVLSRFRTLTAGKLENLDR